MQILYNDPNDPWNQIQFAYEDGKLHVNQVFDAEGVTNAMARRRAEEDQFGKVRNWNLFASIPNTIVYKLKQEGIDIFRMNKDPAMRKRFLRKMQYDYKDFKGTNKVHL